VTRDALRVTRLVISRLARPTPDASAPAAHRCAGASARKFGRPASHAIDGPT